MGKVILRHINANSEVEYVGPFNNKAEVEAYVKGHFGDDYNVGDGEYGNNFDCFELKER